MRLLRLSNSGAYRSTQLRIVVCEIDRLLPDGMLVWWVRFAFWRSMHAAACWYADRRPRTGIQGAMFARVRTARKRSESGDRYVDNVRRRLDAMPQGPLSEDACSRIAARLPTHRSSTRIGRTSISDRAAPAGFSAPLRLTYRFWLHPCELGRSSVRCTGVASSNG